ncbi:MAG: hypothetical protein KDK00_03060 [Rhodobacteraceae bacterium]|nr:hypothetical protein [Paracoccaceae bacterium]
MSALLDTGLLPSMSRADKARLVLRALDQARARDSWADASSGAGQKTLTAALSDLLRDINPRDETPAAIPEPAPCSSENPARAPETVIALGDAQVVKPDLGCEHPLTAAEVIGHLPTEQAAAILRQMPTDQAQRIVLALGPAGKSAAGALSEHASRIIRAMT